MDQSATELKQTESDEFPTFKTINQQRPDHSPRPLL